MVAVVALGHYLFTRRHSSQRDEFHLAQMHR